MKHRIKSLFVFPTCARLQLSIIPTLLLALTLVLGGCGTIVSGVYPTLKQTEVRVSWPMTRYRTAAGFGGLTLAEKERMNTAYVAYQAAFDQALQAAGGNYDAPTPENVKARANELLDVLAGIPLVS